MLEHVPVWLGRMLANVRAGTDKLTIVQDGLGLQEAGWGVPSLDLTSPAFADGAALPVRFTADGAGVSPPLTWGTPPFGTASLALLVEDADAPTPQPLVHAVIWGLAADAGRLAEGAIVADGAATLNRDGVGGDDVGGDVGRNSFLREGWLPPDPPTGHGPHRYCFQLFALGVGAGHPGTSPGRSALVEAMRGHVLAAGLLTGTYERGGEAAAPIGVAATAR